MKYEFRLLSLNQVNWDDVESIHEHTAFHTQKWASFVRRCGYRPWIVAIYKDEAIVGYFISTIVGHVIKMICAPLGGLGYTQGLILKFPIEYSDRVQLYKELTSWIFVNRYAHYISVDDWCLRLSSKEWNEEYSSHNELLEKAQVQYSIRTTLYLPLEKSIEELWGGLHYKSAKYSINKARKAGLYTRVVCKKEDINDFVDKHYDQICDVCRRHGSKPKLVQSKQRIQKICESTFPDRSLMIQVVGKDENGVEQIMSSAVFIIGENEAIYSTGASYQKYQKYCPNEIMVWDAICLLKERGVKNLNYGGMGEYKLKFGTIYAYLPRIVFSKYAFIDNMRRKIKSIYEKYLYRK